MYPAVISFDVDNNDVGDDSDIPNERMVNDTGQNNIKDFGTVSVAIPNKPHKEK
jgi:hypothetical protein